MRDARSPTGGLCGCHDDDKVGTVRAVLAGVSPPANVCRWMLRVSGGQHGECRS
jgi:hypothetical protein